MKYRVYNEVGYTEYTKIEDIPEGDVYETLPDEPVEAFNEQDFLKQAALASLDEYYTDRIDKLVSKHVQASIIDNIPIPGEVLAERQRLRLEYQERKDEIMNSDLVNGG